MRHLDFEVECCVMKNPSNACAATEQMLNGSTGRGAKYLLELLLADEQDVKLLWKQRAPVHFLGFWLQLKDGWQIAVENDIPYLLGPWRHLSSFRRDVLCDRACSTVDMLDGTN